MLHRDKLGHAQTSLGVTGWCPRWGWGPRKLSLISEQNFPNTQPLLRLEPLAAMVPHHFDQPRAGFLQNYLQKVHKRSKVGQRAEPVAEVENGDFTPGDGFPIGSGSLQ